uniref:Uncharacterized protein n=1 Tax=Timema poppense TaxID=170557 RepID=A0A7R9DHR5_TIMPO|nr:unnamed protein product [Timema poppensis]
MKEESNFMEVELDLPTCVSPKCCTDEEKSIKLKKRRQRSSIKETKSSLVPLREHNEGGVTNSAEDQAATLEVGSGETINSTELKVTTL